MIPPTPQIAAVPTLVPFIGPEHLARKAGLDAGSLVRLGANESGFGPAPAVVAALEEALLEVAHYGDPENHALRADLAARYSVPFERIVIANGIDELMGLITRVYLSPGDTVVTTAGSYPTFTFHILGFGGRLLTAEYRDGKPDLDALAQLAQQERPRIVYLANPDNPSGGFWEQADIAAFIDAIPRETLIFLDEAYAEYAPTPLVPQERENVIQFRTFSKAYGLAGMRIGYAFMPPEAVEFCDKVRLHFGVTRLSQIAARVALSRSAFVNSVLAETERGRHEYVRWAQELGLSTYPSATNFVLFELGSVARAEQLVRELLQRQVFIRKPGNGPLATCVRITIGTAHQRRVLWHALAQSLEAIRGPAV